MVDKNGRQMNLMLESLDAFDNEAISLRTVISRLDGLLNALDGMDDHWRKAFQRHWGLLEDVYANTLDREYATIPREHMLLVNKATAEIRRLIAEGQSESHEQG